MTPLKRGDVVVYVFPKAPQWHGTLAIVEKWEPPGAEDWAEYPIWILDYISVVPGFPYAINDHTPWHKTAWEKVGHLDGI